jgi:hypothetical protein
MIQFPTDSHLITIDPGYGKESDGCACASFVYGELSSAWFARPEQIINAGPFTRADWHPSWASPIAVIWEKPQHRKEDPNFANIPVNVLIELAAQGASVAALLAALTNARALLGVTPSEWKSSQHKPVHHGHVWRKLKDGERGLLGGDVTEREINAAKRRGALERWKKPGVAYYPSTFKTHNLLDAVAMGILFLGR